MGDTEHEPRIQIQNGLKQWLQLRLPICEIWCETFQLFSSLVYFILPFRAKKLKNFASNFADR